MCINAVYMKELPFIPFIYNARIPYNKYTTYKVIAKLKLIFFFTAESKKKIYIFFILTILILSLSQNR